MEKKIQLTIVGERTDEQGSGGEIKFFTEGRLFSSGGQTRITYMESPEAGTDCGEMSVVMEDGGVAVFREGDYASHFVFKKGQKYLNIYHTPQGAIEFGAYPIDVRYDIGDGAGEIFLCYELDMQGTPLGTNRLHMTWREDMSGA